MFIKKYNSDLNEFYKFLSSTRVWTSQLKYANNIEIDSKIKCISCNEQEVRENHYHFLFDCKSYSDLRAKYAINQPEWKDPDTCRKNLKTWTSLRRVIKYCAEAIRARAQYTRSLSTNRR